MSGLVDSDSDDIQFVERDAMPTPDSAAENKAPGKRGRGRPKAAVSAKVTKTKAPARRTSGRLVAKSKAVAAPKGKRKALADKTNQQHASDTEEVEEFDDIAMGGEPDPLVAKEPESKATKKKAPVGRGKIAKEVSTNTNYSIEDITPPAPRLESRATKEKLPLKRQAPTAPTSKEVIQESQVPDMEIDGDEEVEQDISVEIQSAQRPRSQSRPRQPSVPRRRAGSVLDTERSDPILRRKLGEMTKKYESLNVKYQDLREIGLKEAERNFERLKKQSEEKTAGNATCLCNKTETNST